MKVFLVDDSAVFLQRLKRMFTNVPEIIVIGETGNAQLAPDAIFKQNPDVVILDINLLNGNGIEVLQHLKKFMPTLAVMILTNYPYPQYRQKCLAAGANYYFVKSTEFDQVVPALKQLIQPTPDVAWVCQTNDPAMVHSDHRGVQNVSHRYSYQ